MPSSLQVDSQLIDRIVREVLRRLTEGEQDRLQPEERIEAPSPPGQPLILNEPVITMASIEGRLNNVARVHVLTRAIVTPAVRDELRDRGIQLERGEVNGANASPLHVALCCSENELSLRKQLAGSAGEHEVIGYTCIEAAVDRTCELVAASRQAALITDQPAVAVCRANRNRAVRAAHAHDVGTTRESLRTLQPNLLVIHSQNPNLQQIVRVYSG